MEKILVMLRFLINYLIEKLIKTLIHQYVVSTLSNIRKGTRAQKNRSEIVASGRKPWRQKGTGRARAGSIGSPIWRGGGRAFPSSVNENFHKKINKKSRKAALSSILSKKIDDKDLIVIDELKLIPIKQRILSKF